MFSVDSSYHVEVQNRKHGGDKFEIPLVLVLIRTLPYLSDQGR